MEGCEDGGLHQALLSTFVPSSGDSSGASVVGKGLSFLRLLPSPGDPPDAAEAISAFGAPVTGFGSGVGFAAGGASEADVMAGYGPGFEGAGGAAFAAVSAIP